MRQRERDHRALQTLGIRELPPTITTSFTSDACIFPSANTFLISWMQASNSFMFSCSNLARET